MRTWTPLAASVALLLGAAVKYPSEYSSALIGAGLVTFGSWLTVEISERIVDLRNRKKGDKPDV